MAQKQIFPTYDLDIKEDNGYSLSANEKTKLRAESLFTIKSIVERYGGTADIDLATYTLNINVPKKNEKACEQEIDEQMKFFYR